MSIKILSIYKALNTSSIYIITGVTDTTVYADELSFNLETTENKLTHVSTSRNECEYGALEFNKMVAKGHLYLCNKNLLDLLQSLVPQSWLSEVGSVERDLNPDPFKKFMTPLEDKISGNPVDITEPLDIP